MHLQILLYRLRWFHAPAAVLMMLLQRTPVLRLVTGGAVNNAGLQPVDVLKSVFALAALGAYNSVAGATTFNATVVSPTTVTPASGKASSTFTASGAQNAAFSLSFNVSGAPGTSKSWKVLGTLPAGLSVTGGTAITGGYLFNGITKVTLAGTPTSTASQTLTFTAYDSTGGTGNNAHITCIVNITGGVSAAPAFTTQPTTQTVTAGANVTFTVAVTGTPTPTLQWYKDSVALSGQTGATLSLSNVQAGDAGSYTVKATNTAAPSGVSSSAATLTVNPASVAPAFTTQPASQTVTAGANVTFTVAVTGAPTPTLQWYKDSVALSGQTGTTLSVTNVQPAHAGSYTVTAVNSMAVKGVSSTAATLTVAVPPPATITLSRSYSIGEQMALDLTGGTTFPQGITFYGSKLPTGLKIDSASGQLTGLLSGKTGTYTITYWTQSGSTKSVSRTLTLTVVAFPTTMTGGFETLLEDTSVAAVAPFPVGKVALTVSATSGAFTGTLTTADAKPYAFKGTLTLGADLASGNATVTVARTKGLIPSAYQLGLSVAATGVLSASLSTSDGLVGGGTGAKLAGVATVATYAMIVRAPTNLGSITAYPHGDGYASVTASKTGVFALKGKLGDGATLTATASLGADGLLRPYAKPYGTAGGYLAGTLKITARGDNAALSHITAANGSDFYWTKPIVAKTTSYVSGFGPLALQVVMEPWNASPATGFGSRLGLAPDGNFTVSILGDYQSNTGPNVNAFLPVTLNLSSTNALTVVGANSTAWTLKLTSKTGVFTGTCYPSADKVSTHKSTVEGVLFQPAPGDTLIGGGYLLAPAQDGSQITSTSSVEFSTP